jgi:hypothetical protein
MKTTRLLPVLLALPLLAFDCGGKEEVQDPFGLGCTVHVEGAAPSEDLWCVVAAYDYSAFPQPYGSHMWGFIISAYRGTDVGAGGGIYLAGRPVEGVPYSWNGNSASSIIDGGGFNRYAGSMSAGTYVLTHANSTLGNGDGTGSATVTFTAIPPANATNEQLIGVHGTFTATLLPRDGFSGVVTLTARF